MDKITLLKKREEFFKSILDVLQLPIAKIDILLNQDKYYVPIEKKKTFYELELGDMAICIKGSFYNKKFEIYYSVWQLGDKLKIAIAIKDDSLQGAFASDAHNEVFYIWGDNHEPRVDLAHGCIFYDWEFTEPSLYDNYKNQEKYILGIRHMHFRVMRMICDECERIASVKKDEKISIEKHLEQILDIDSDD